MKYGRRDNNHSEVRDFLRTIPGCQVHDTGDVGDGFPDLVVGFMGNIWLMEVKDGSKPPSKRRLTKDEKRFHKRWEHIGNVVVVNSINAACRALGIDTQEAPF